MEKIIEKSVKIAKGNRWLAISDGIVLLVLLAIGVAFYFEYQSIANLRADLTVTNKSLNTVELSLATTTEAGKILAQQLLDQQNQNNNIAETLNGISGTVGTLEKLSKTDKELLQKYSKVYFLSDNYVPLSLANIDKQYLADQTKNLQFHTSALSFLQNMMSDARRQGVDLYVVSSYRSFGTQSDLKASYKVTYGSGANSFSADQGYSEHQLGTAVDLTMLGQIPNLLIAFDQTIGFDWLNKNAYRYGFILSYPKGNTYYQYEPWHWRFVGRSLATTLHNQGKNFSDMDQREIDTYLANIFD
jgi:D-alanyl-D-alanine carboxypeptidase